ncbi:MAG: type II toxin-antitoxin system RelE/ParE family toxin [Tepidisphaeraceae bacterium]
MPYEIVVMPEAEEDLDRLRATDRSAVKAAIQTHLRHEPERIGKSRIKRLRGLRRPQYRLRVANIRVFYDVTADTVEVLGIVEKSQAADWLADAGE